MLTGDTYTREPAGTKAERDAATLRSRISAHRRQHDRRAAQKILSTLLPDAPTGEQVQRRIDAQLLLSGVA
jgi:hypothetical protein